MKACFHALQQSAFRRGAAIVGLVIMLAAMPALAVPTIVVSIVDQGEPTSTSIPIANPNPPQDGQFAGVSFTTFSALSNVSIFASLIVAANQTATVRAFLSTEIGAGTNASHIVAQTEFQLSGSGSTLLFQLASLAADRYYVTLAPGVSETGTAFAWDAVEDGFEGLLTPGGLAGYSGDYNLLGTSPALDTTLPPASSFSTPNLNPGANRLFTVFTDPEATPIPEPPMAVLMLTVLAALSGIRRRGARRTASRRCPAPR